NNIESIKELVANNKDEIAAVIIEPIAGNMGVIKSEDNFLKELRSICDEEGIVLIFDEVMTGFRVAKGGAQEILGITPDLSTFGKIIGGGLPVGAFGGKAEIMNQIAPVGPIYQAGTLSGNPLAMSAGFAALNYIKNNPNIYDLLEEKSAYLADGFAKNLEKIGKKYAMTRIGSMMCMFFTEEEVTDFQSAVKSNTELYGKYFHKMLEQGIYLAPAQFEALFVSTVHSKEDFDKTINAHYNSLIEIL
ncbi:MAG: aminotransferase class III-fold pyridoxal phosphate-dependent enzyme, partial [Ignavibacteriales bacterium]|nr:aminotransferase class III-fold pyridoxal phosphate-dependent enzyme [Ignavibacteriales bacterium]